ncbi:MAG: ABC transporter ATP-binding protein [Candidatus Bathyarchaeia archaeon]
MTRVLLKGITKEFGSLTAVHKLDLEIKDKEFIALLGPSGCGKTTTLNMIAGLENPTNGEIYFDDKLVNPLASRDRGVGLVFQSYAVFSHMTVFDNIAFGLRIRNMSESDIKREVEHMAELLGLKELLHNKAAKLAISTLQKVALGRTLVTRPKVLLLDEPLSNLDTSLRAIARAELKRFQKEIEQTTIFVTHDQLEAMTLAGRIAIMNFGKLQQYDPPEVVYENPGNLFVANFVGTPSMNFFDCSFQLKGDKAFLVHEQFQLDATQYRSAIEKGAKGSELLLGVRPEYISVTREKPKDDSAVKANLILSELVGYEYILHVEIGKKMFRIVLPKTEVSQGQDCWLEFQKDKIHVFEKKSGEVLV